MSTNSTFDCSASTRAMSSSKQNWRRTSASPSSSPGCFSSSARSSSSFVTRPLAQEQRAEVRARLVLEEAVVETCGPHVPVGIGISRRRLERRAEYGLFRRESGAARARARRSGSRSAPRPCAGCRRRGRARARSRPPDRAGSGRRGPRRRRPPCPESGTPRGAQSRPRAGTSRACSGRERLLGLEPHRLGVSDRHRDAHAGRAQRQLGQLEDLARLVAQLRLLLELLAVEVPVHRQVVLGLRLVEQPLQRAALRRPEADW